MIKKISILFLLATLILVTSCSSDSESDSDGNSQTKVKYRVTVGSGVTISTVNYRDAAGEFVTVTASNPSEWTKEITVETPYDADFDALITNTSGSSKPYTAYIYVNGILTVSSSGFIANEEFQHIGQSCTID